MPTNVGAQYNPSLNRSTDFGEHRLPTFVTIISLTNPRPTQSAGQKRMQSR